VLAAGITFFLGAACFAAGLVSFLAGGVWCSCCAPADKRPNEKIMTMVRSVFISVKARTAFDFPCYKENAGHAFSFNIIP
jgi:hypothetical protein